MKIENITTNRLSNPFDNYRLQSAQDIYNNNRKELADFVNEIGAKQMLDNQIDGYRFERIKNFLHMTNE